MICSQEGLVTLGTLDLAFSKRNTRKTVVGLQVTTEAHTSPSPPQALVRAALPSRIRLLQEMQHTDES